MRTLLVVLACGCGGGAQVPALSHAGPAGPPPPAPPHRWIDRNLIVSKAEGLAMRGAFIITIDGGQATLERITEEAAGDFTLARADREARWVETARGAYHGPAHTAGDHLALDFDSKDDSLWLRCWTRSIVVAKAGAVRVHRPGHAGDCSDTGMWSPPEMVHVDALVCGQGEGLDDGQIQGMDGRLGSLDETLFRFLPDPGVEFVEIDDGCFESTGLRLAK